MTITETELPGVLIIEPRIFRDARGYFLETWNRGRYASSGLEVDFVQDNLSYSSRGVLRGLHYQHPSGQGKLVGVAMGEVFDVAVDIRTGSPTFGRWVGALLSSETGRQMYIPSGFAHGFLVTSDGALFSYKCSESYRPEFEGVLLWDDPALGIAWPLESPILAPKDAGAPRLSAIPADRLPPYEASPRPMGPSHR